VTCRLDLSTIWFPLSKVSFIPVDQMLLTINLESKVVDSSRSSQCDPIECLDGILRYFDRLLVKTGRPGSFVDFFSPAINKTYSCTACTFTVSERSICSGPVLIHPHDMGSSNLSLCKILDDEIMGVSEPGKTCRRCGQIGTWKQTKGLLSMGIARCLVINVVLSHTTVPSGVPLGESDPITVASGRKFTIPLSLDNPKILNGQLRLIGIICHVGRQTIGAHYVSLVLVQGRWWIIDDHEVELARGPSAAFDGGRYPVGLFYLGGDGQSGDLGLGARSSQQSTGPQRGSANATAGRKRARSVSERDERLRERSPIAEDPFFHSLEIGHIASRIKNQTWISRGKQQPLLCVPHQVTDHPTFFTIGKILVWGQTYLPDCFSLSVSRLLDYSIGCTLEQLLSMIEGKSMWSSGAIKGLARLFEHMINTKYRTPHPPPNSCRASFVADIGGKDSESGNPWTALGVNGEWRQRRWVGLISMKDNAFSVAAIHSTAKLVVIYDCCAGSWATDQLELVSFSAPTEG
jgi:hypothetical protein